jgi:hypothetical protein
MSGILGIEDFLESGRKLDKLAKEFGNEALRRVKNYTPVETGLLQQSWELKVDKGNGELVLTNTAKNTEGQYYAPYVEFGTRHSRGAFMATRMLAEASQILRIAKRKAGL